MFQDMIKPVNGSGGGITYKIHSEGSFTIANNTTKTITISDMNHFVFLYGSVSWTNQFGFLYSEDIGDKTCRNGVWETSGSTFLHVTVDGNQVKITNPSGTQGTASVSSCDIQYY